MEENLFDVIVVGAGAAGLTAAWELVQTGKRTAIVEARDRVGGRIHTVNDKNFEIPVELGAEFVHGNLELTELILKKGAFEQYRAAGEIWHNMEGELDRQNDFIEDYSALNKKFKELKEDTSVASFIENYLQGDEFEEARFTLKNYVEGYYAANTDRASTFCLRQELSSSDYDQYRVEGGYIKLAEYLHQQCKQKGVEFFFSEAVKKIKWKRNEVQLVTAQQLFNANKVLITVPIGVLQSETIQFLPQLPDVISAAKKLGYGGVIKIILQFDHAFWKNKEFTKGKNLDKLSFIFSGAAIPTWWTYYPKNVALLTGWSAGPHAEEIKDLNDEEILQKALQSLSDIFTIPVSLLHQQLKGWHVANWVKDRYSCGGYSYEVVNGTQIKKVLKDAVENTIWFAGEGLFDGPEIGTVEAALSSGRETAHQLIASFKK